MKNSLSKSSVIIRNLNKLRNQGWNAIIAGSAIRDTYHDVKITTVDVFIQANTKLVKDIDIDFKALDWMEYWYRIFDCNMDKNDDVVYLGSYETYSKLDPHIYAVWHIFTSGKKYQVILLNKDPQEYVKENFDFGICRAYCDGTKMHFTSDFLNDSLNKTITLYPENLTQAQIDYALGDHIKSISRKYPGWTLRQ